MIEQAAKAKRKAAVKTKSPAQASSKKTPTAKKPATNTSRTKPDTKRSTARNKASDKDLAFSISDGMNAFGAAMSSYAQEQMDDTVAAAQRLLNCRTLEDMATVQSQYVQHSLQRLVKQANNLSQSAESYDLGELMRRFYRTV